MSPIGLGRSPLRRRPKKRPPEGPLTPIEWQRQAIMAAPRRRGLPLCAVTGEPIPSVLLIEVHHPVEKSWLRREGLFHLVWDARNAMVVHQRVHEAHTNGSARIAREKVPQSAWDFADEIGPPARLAIERTHHPTEGGQADA